MSAELASLQELFERNRRGERVGVYSVCSAHPLVIRAALALAHDRRQLAVIEATCNQVNQFGGYTGMRPADFAEHVRREAAAVGLPPDALVLGGDHLGPQPWRKEPAEVALAKARTMVADYVRAGFTKIHLDCSMRCGDDPALLPETVIAERAAQLADAAEAAAREAGTRPVYVIGTEVPPPGGMGEGHDIVPTSVDGVAGTWRTHEAAFAQRGLQDAFARVMAIVVQPGLDFGNEHVVRFQPEEATALSAGVMDLAGAVYEAHSTDYQQAGAYKALVDGHFAILKVGPAATFALREALYALEAIEAELVPPPQRSRLRAALEAAMLAAPDSWSSHYTGTAEQQAYLRHFSFSDRLRYYWTVPEVEAAVRRLFGNLDRGDLPLPLVSQHLPQLYDDVVAGRIVPRPDPVVVANVQRALAPYAEACGSHERARSPEVPAV